MELALLQGQEQQLATSRACRLTGSQPHSTNNTLHLTHKSPDDRFRRNPTPNGALEAAFCTGLWHPSSFRDWSSAACGDAEPSGTILSSLLCLAPARNQLLGKVFYPSEAGAQDGVWEPGGPQWCLLLAEGLQKRG